MSFSDPVTFIILAVVGAVAGFLNVLAGGGSALTIPLMIFLGYDATVANGSNRIAIQVEALSAVAAFKKQKHSDFPMSLKLSLMTLPGGILGAFYAVKIDDALFTKILAVVMVLIIITLMFPKAELVEHAKNHKWKNWLSWPVMFAVGFYGGFIQAGVGFVIMSVLLHLYNMDLVKINMHKVFIVMVFTVPAVIMFIWTDNVDWFAAVALSVGMVFGTWVAVKMAIEKGEKLVRIVLGVSLLIIAGKLFLM
ncbi:MAG: sulfite exporter TauE/SafE family protein [Cocleimonas sp.]|nr:sulfite exporter TauE/SafE family protein [Cocleimonas sp.]